MASAEAALAAVQTHRPGVVLIDVGLSEAQDGLTVGHAIQAMDGTPVIYLSGHSPAQLTAQPRGPGLLFYLLKPVTPKVLARTVEQVLAYAARQHTFQALQQDVSENLQRTRALRAMVKALRQAATRSRPVRPSRAPRRPSPSRP